MNFMKHYDLVGKHAVLSASKWHWLNYDEARMIDIYHNQLAAERGTILHNFAAQAISLGQKLPRSKKTLNMYVNDAINFAMTPEQVLFYSDRCFGTADTICFRNGYLRIHDLKTGVSAANMNQLKIYMALFCLEYNERPDKIDNELRIYQNDDIDILNADPEEIVYIMDKIKTFDALIEKIQREEG